jgi:hypothetical protein
VITVFLVAVLTIFSARLIEAQILRKDQ